MNRKHPTKKILAYSLIGISSLVMLVPFLFALSNSLKTYAQYTAIPPIWIPHPLQWINYVNVFKLAQFGTWAVNSLIVTVLSVLGALISCSLIAFAFARLRFPLKNTLFAIVLGTMMIPPVVTIIPQFIIFNKLHMVNTLTPLWILEFLGQPFGVFLLRQAFMVIPRDYEESARIEGANPFQIYWRIFIPMVKPALATLAVFTFMNKWNEILMPIIYLSSPKNFTLSIGVLSLNGQFVGNGQYLVAAAIMILIPILVVFIFAQKYFVQSFTSSGLK